MNIKAENNVFSANLTALMHAHRLSDKKLSDALSDLRDIDGYNYKLSPRAINSLKKGQSLPQNRTLEGIERYFNRNNLLEEVVDKTKLTRKQGEAWGEFGGYKFDDFRYLLGDYLSFRNSFDYPDGIVCSHLKISESRSKGVFRFREKQRNLSRENETYTYSHKGNVSVLIQERIVQLRADEVPLKRSTSFKDIGSGHLVGVLQAIGLDELTGSFPVATGCVAVKLDAGEKHLIEEWLGSITNAELEEKLPDAGSLSKVRSRMDLVRRKYIK